MLSQLCTIILTGSVWFFTHLACFNNFCLESVWLIFGIDTKLLQIAHWMEKKGNFTAHAPFSSLPICSALDFLLTLQRLPQLV